jgi:hypothetical protein
LLGLLGLRGYSNLRDTRTPGRSNPGTLEPRIAASRHDENRQRKHTVKKLIVLALVALGLAAVWRKVQTDRAELDLWTEATTADE